MADHAKLELLARAADSGKFQIIEIDSRTAYWAYRPQRLSQADWELTTLPKGADGGRHFVLRNLVQDSYLLLNPREHFLWEHFDGRHSLEEIARAFHLTFGAFDYGLIRQLLAKLYHHGLLERQRVLDSQLNTAGGRDPRWTRRVARKLRKWCDFSFRVPHADRFCSRIYRRGGFLLFHPFTFWLSLAVFIFALALALEPGQNATIFAYYLRTQPLLISAVMLATLLGASVLHVLVHALACKAHGRRVRELGFFLLQGIVPTLYADVTDIFMSTRRARVLVDLAGPMVEVVLGSVAVLGAQAASSGLQQAILFGMGLTLWESALINLYPFNFLEMDGYNIIADVLSMPMLRQQALALIPKLSQRLRHFRTMDRAEWLQLTYLVLSCVSVTVYLMLHIDGIRALVHFSS